MSTLNALCISEMFFTSSVSKIIDLSLLWILLSSINLMAFSKSTRPERLLPTNVRPFSRISLAFIVSSILKKKYPDTKIIVIGKNTSKLSQFSFVDETILADDLEEGFNVDHAFECAGGEGSFYAIDNII